MSHLYDKLILRLCIVSKNNSFIEKLPFGPYLLISKSVKPGHYSVLPSHILRVLLTKYGLINYLWHGINRHKRHDVITIKPV